MIQEVYIADAIRSPIGKLSGTLSAVRADNLAAMAIAKLLERNRQLNTELIDEVIFGCANQAGEDNRNVARMASLLAGLPFSVPASTVNRLCASGMTAVIESCRATAIGDGNIYIAGGVENMSRAPFVLSKAEKAFSGKIEIFDTSLGWRFINPKMHEMYGTDSMGETAENLADLYKISREEQDEFAFNSQMKAAKAIEIGRFKREIFEVEILQKSGNPLFFETDEFVKPDTTIEILSKLKPAFRKNGTVTAGNSSGLNDGSAALIIANEEGLKSGNLKPRAKIISNSVVGVEPRIMGIGPVNATKKALKKAGLNLDNMDVIELNEAFAAQSIVVLKELNISLNDKRLNPNGGAIALGHPLGMSGARLITTAINELEKTNGKYALCTLCVGVGQGQAVIIERI